MTGRALAFGGFLPVYIFLNENSLKFKLSNILTFFDCEWDYQQALLPASMTIWNTNFLKREFRFVT